MKMIKFTNPLPLVSMGPHNAELVDIQTITTQFGESYKLFFELYDLDDMPKLSGICSQKWSPLSKLNQWLMVLNDHKPLDTKKDIDLDDYIGAKLMIMVENKTDSKGGEVSNVSTLLKLIAPPPF
jgi:hypothetical protein